jgi:hypothetical protein
VRGLVILGAGLGLLGFALGCGTPCLRGETEPCGCPDGQPGARVCASDGRFGACVCTRGWDAGAARPRDGGAP